MPSTAPRDDEIEDIIDLLRSFAARAGDDDLLELKHAVLDALFALRDKVGLSAQPSRALN